MSLGNSLIWINKKGVASLFKRVMIALLLTVLFGLSHAHLTYGSIHVSLLTVGFGFILGGIPASILIDTYVHKESMKILFYLLSGFVLVGLVLTVILLIFDDAAWIIPVMIWYGPYGLVGGFLFYILMFLATKLQSMYKRRT